MSTEKHVAVVTGSSNGFGRDTVELFLREGWRVFATMRGADAKNAKAAGELRALGAEIVELDVTSDASVNAAAKTILAASDGRVDVLVNNAGTGHFGFVEAHTPQSAEKQFATNVVGPLRVNRAFLPSMRARKSGLVVYVGSVVGRLIYPFSGIYVASKFAIEALAESAAYELRPFNVDVAIVQPGAYATNIFSSIVLPDDAARLAEYAVLDKHFETLNAGLGSATQGKSSTEVADAIVALAKAPAGARPLRTVVGGDPRANQINDLTAPIQRSILTDFGFTDLLLAEPAAV
jgi:NAD(P)-dependent dehydrogenase (short-subunit alcohol dehydrogenase family)